jgi:hypothetical protein
MTKRRLKSNKKRLKILKYFCPRFYQTIHRKVIGLASTVAFYNLHQSLEKPEEKPLVITVGGLRYIGNIYALRRTYLLEQKYRRKFLSHPLDDYEKVFPRKSTWVALKMHLHMIILLQESLRKKKKIRRYLHLTILIHTVRYGKKKI